MLFYKQISLITNILIFMTACAAPSFAMKRIERELKNVQSMEEIDAVATSEDLHEWTIDIKGEKIKYTIPSKSYPFKWFQISSISHENNEKRVLNLLIKKENEKTPENWSPQMTIEKSLTNILEKYYKYIESLTDFGCEHAIKVTTGDEVKYLVYDVKSGFSLGDFFQKSSFIIEKIPHGKYFKIAIRLADNNYVTADSDKKKVAAQPHPFHEALFDMVERDNGRYFLKTAHRTYLRLNFTYNTLDQSPYQGEWESFELVPNESELERAKRIEGVNAIKASSDLREWIIDFKGGTLKYTMSQNYPLEAFKLQESPNEYNEIAPVIAALVQEETKNLEKNWSPGYKVISSLQNLSALYDHIINQQIETGKKHAIKSQQEAGNHYVSYIPNKGFFLNNFIQRMPFTIEKVPNINNFKIALKLGDSYLSADGDRKTVNVQPHLLSYECFEVQQHYNCKYFLKTAHGTFLSFNQQTGLLDQSPYQGSGELFELVLDEFMPGEYYIASEDNRFISYKWPDSFTLEKGNKKPFTFISINDKSVAIKVHDSYISAHCDKKTINLQPHAKEWELFEIEKQENGKYLLKTAHDTYLSANMYEGSFGQSEYKGNFEMLSLQKSFGGSKKRWDGQLPLFSYFNAIIPKEHVNGGIASIQVGCGGPIMLQKYDPKLQEALNEGRYLLIILIDPFLTPCQKDIIVTENDKYKIVYLNRYLTEEDKYDSEVLLHELSNKGFSVSAKNYSGGSSNLIGTPVHTNSDQCYSELFPDDVVDDILAKTLEPGLRKCVSQETLNAGRSVTYYYSILHNRIQHDYSEINLAQEMVNLDGGDFGIRKKRFLMQEF